MSSQGPSGPPLSEAAGMIKGAPLVEFLRWYASRFGAERLRGLVEGIPPELGVPLNLEYEHLGLLSSAWYRAPVIHAVIEQIIAPMTPAEQDALSREAARAVAEGTLKGVYRILFSFMMSPSRYIQNAQRLFSRYYRPGTLVKTPLGPSGHRTTVSGWTGHHPFLCRNLAYTSEYIYRAMGCRDVAVRRTGCVDEGAPECSFEATWSAG